jgi:release factor glutamine methyltransferase
LPEGPWDLVVSNPPYVEPAELDTLMPDVREYEPHVALVGAPGGGSATEAVARSAYAVLRPGAWLVLEIGHGQAGQTLALLAGLGYGETVATQDLAGRERVVEGRRG